MKINNLVILLSIILCAFFLVLIKPSSAFSLIEHVKGKILLQVQSKGEAWYVYPDELKRYYLGRPDDAFNIMRNLGLGITNADLKKIPIGYIPSTGIDSDGDGLSDAFEYAYGSDINNADSDGDGYDDKTEVINDYSPLNPSPQKLNFDSILRNRLSGKILLQVESKGEAWYVSPDNLRRYYLGRPHDAFNIMRELGLGITESDLNQIAISPSSASVSSAPTPTPTQTNQPNQSQQPEIPVLQAPSSQSIEDTGSGNSLRINWVNSTASNFSHVNIYRSLINGQLGQLISSTQSSPYLDTGLTNYAVYYYTIRSVDSFGKESTNIEQLSEMPTKNYGTPPAVNLDYDYKHNGVLDVDIIVDDDSGYNINSGEIATFFTIARNELYKRTGRVMEKRNIDFLPLGNGTESDMVREHLSKQLMIPEAIIIFTFGNGNSAKIFGGYSAHYFLDTQFCSEFRGTSNVIPLIITDWHHWYARCGYDDNLNRISDVSIEGECGNIRGTTCVLRDDKEYYMCENYMNDLYSNLNFETAALVIHELLHQYQAGGVSMHYGTAECIETLNSNLLQDPNFRINSQKNYGMCPTSYEFLRNSFIACP
ncbi:MAG: hypothetical protein ACOZBH_02865 [Patescibacteria group bacterium]